MDERLNEINRELKELNEALARQGRMEAQWKDLQDQRAERDRRVMETGRVFRKEQDDVDRLEKGGLRALLLSLTGDREVRLSKERREALAAKLQYDQAQRDLEDLDGRIGVLLREKDGLRIDRIRRDALLEEKGEALFAAWHRRLTEFDQGIQGLRHLRVLGHGREAGAHYPGIFALDPAKILISTQGTGLTGVALRDLLRREYRIEVEMALDHYVLAMTGLGTDDAMPARLAQALLAIDETCASSEETPSVLAVPGALPPRRCSLEEAAQAPGGLSFLYDAMGKVCGEYIWAYPPGIPLIAPGEEITPPLVETVEGLYRAGVRLIGTRGKPPFTTFALGDQDG